MKKCKTCNGTGSVFKESESSWWWNNRGPQIDGPIKVKVPCPKCYGKGVKS